MTLDPYFTGSIEEIPLLDYDALVREVEFFKRTADANGEPHDPEWDRWLAEFPTLDRLP